MKGQHKTKKIIIGEDVRLLQQSLEQVLSEAGNLEIIGEATSGRGVLALYKKHKPDLLLLDLLMPNLNGLAVAGRIRKKDKQTKIVIMTVSENIDAFREAILLGVNGYFLKSDNLDNLRQTILSVLDGLSVFPEVMLKRLASGTEKNSNNNFFEESLSEREREIMFLIIEERTSEQIGEALNISKYTVDNHRKAIYKKLDVKNMRELTNLVKSEGLL